MQQYRLFKRGGVYYTEDAKTGKQKSLRTRDRGEAERMAFHVSEAQSQPHLNLQIGRAYLSAIDPRMIKRTWRDVMEHLQSCGNESTKERGRWATKCKAFDSIRDKPLIETQSEDFLRILGTAGPSVNHFLRRFHNLALGLGWLPMPILAKKFWPMIRHGKKRAITLEEHRKIIAREGNQECRLFYELLWETGASQTDGASLTQENIDWKNRILTIYRQKLSHLDGTPALITIGATLETILRQLPAEGPLFPRLRDTPSKHRATAFHRRCHWLGIRGVSLHSYRYSWAVRAGECGMPERYAQAALGHASKAVHRVYARSARIKVPSLEAYENKAENIVPVNFKAVS